MMTESYWSPKSIYKLIELVKTRECLWNVRCVTYHSVKIRKEAIDEIAKVLKKPVAEIKRKLHILRAQYSKECRKMRESKSKSCSSSHQAYITKWEYFELLQFMFRHKDGNQTFESMAETSVKSQDWENYEGNETDEESISLSSSQTLLQSSQPFFQNENERSRNGIEEEEQEVFSECMPVIPQMKGRDEFSVFGEYVTNELRSLQNVPDLQFKLKNGIQKCIAEVMSEYGEREYHFPGPSSFTSSSIPVKQDDPLRE